MRNLKDFTKMSLNVLKDESKSRGLTDTGTRTDLCTRLYTHDIKKLKKKYHHRKEEGFGRDPDGSKLQARLHHVKMSIKDAARHRFLAEEAYLDKRRVNALRLFEDKLQYADDFAELESTEIEKGVKVLQKRRAAQRALKGASKAMSSSNKENIPPGKVTKCHHLLPPRQNKDFERCTRLDI